MLADVAQKLERTHRRRPIGVVDEPRRRRTIELENLLELRFHTTHVVSQRLAIEKIAFLAATAGISDHAGRTTGEHDRFVSRQLETTQHHLTEQVAGMQGIGGGIEADVHRDRSLVETRTQHRTIGRVVDQPARVEIGEQCVHAHILSRMSDKWRISLGRSEP